MSTVDLSKQRRGMRSAIEVLRTTDGEYAARSYADGCWMGVVEEFVGRYGRRAAFNYFSAILDDLIFTELRGD